MFISWTDTANLLSKLTFNRVINAVKITLSYLWSRITGTAKVFGMPVSLAIEPTTACNLRCPECPSGLRSFTRPTGKLDQSLFQKIIDELAPTTPYLIFYFQGEPYLNPQFLEMVSYASSQNIYTATSTNAHFLDDDHCIRTIEAGLDRMIISIDGTTQETYESYRINGSLKKVLEGTENMIKWKKKMNSSTPQILWQFLVVRPNQHQIDEVRQLARQYGVDKVALKTAQIYDYEHGNELIPTLAKYSRYTKQPEGTYKIKNQLLNHCWKMWSSCVITWDGKIVPCCFDKDANHVMGNLQEEHFRAIWFSRPYDSFRKLLLGGRKQIDMCKNCTEGTKIWA